MMAVLRRDLRRYFGGMFGYTVIALQLLLAGLFILLYNLMARSVDFSLPLMAMQAVLTLILPFLSLRTTVWERGRGTEELLLSLPLTCAETVFGSFLASLSLFLIPTAVLGLFPLLLSAMGTVSLPTAYTAWLGYLLMGIALHALCFWLSSMFANRVAAVLTCLGVLILMHLLSRIVPYLPTLPWVSLLFCLLLCLGAVVWMWRASGRLLPTLAVGLLSAAPVTVTYLLAPERFTALLPDALASLDLFSRMNGMAYGRLDLRTVAFDLCFAIVFLVLSVRLAANRRVS